MSHDDPRESDGLTFDQWIKLVDKEVVKRVYIGYLDIPDVDYRSLFDSGESPSDAAEYALDESGMNWRDE